ncbi:MAG: prephenate dehydrogenase/arogenate dehydrogenase family protein [Conexivisphaerales archaeon]|nr:prephenate dehydrogenase/arogenate dehydrogenase family protein [Conexivisphaerales archaeon]
MKIIIIGAGRMGLWFYKYFSSKNQETYFYDSDLKRVSELKEKGFMYRDIRDIKGFDVVFCSTNMKSIPHIIESVKNSGFENYFTEISGLKEPIVRNLTALKKPISVHPLFGPGAKKAVGKKIIHVPVKDKEGEYKTVKELFPEMEVVTMSAEEHDALVTRTIQLVQLLSMIYNRLSVEGDWGSSQKMMKFVESVSLYNSDELIKEIFELNKHTKELEKNVQEVLNEINSGDYRIMKKNYFEDLYNKAYKIMEEDNM